MDDTYTMIPMFASLAVETSMTTCKYGVLFGGTTSWVLVVIMSNDSGEHPWAPLQAAVIGFPITILCDIALIIPTLIIQFLTYH